MTIRIYNAKILPMGDRADVFDGEIQITDGVITYVGEVSPLNEQYFDREIDANGNLVMPGFKNCHTHTPMTFLRSYADDLPLQEWLFNRVFPMEGKLSPQAAYTFTKLGIMEYLSSGITTSFDMYFHPEMIAKAAVDTGFRLVLCGAVDGAPENVNKLRENYEKFSKLDELISYRLGFHAEYTASYDLLVEVGKLANELKKPVYMHCSETEREVKECVDKYGKTPVELFDSVGIFNYGGAGFHLVHTTENDMNILKSKNVGVVTNPASNAKLASGIAPICDYIEKGISVAIGTDGAASNNCLDMFREMFLVTGLQKLQRKDAAACDAVEVLRMATTNGARMLGLDECDSLAAGKKADLIILDLHQPNMQPLNNIVKNVVYSGSKANVKLTMINGKVLYEDGKYFIGEEAEAVYSEANRLMETFR